MMQYRLNRPYLSALISALFLMFLLMGCGSTNSGSNSGVNFDSGNIPPAGTFSFTFKKAGTYNYYCRIHQPDMTGKVVVNKSAQIGGQDTVEMKNIQFVPGQVSVMPDTKIIWINKDNVNHTVVSGSPSSNGGSGYGY